MRTREELNTIKEEVEALNRKLADLTEDELKQVCGGGSDRPPRNGDDWGHGNSDGTYTYGIITETEAEDKRR